jgi:hypothetical protein
MWKIATFMAAAATIAILGLLIFFLEKTKPGEEGVLMATWFRLCDWLLPNSRPASSRQNEIATTLPPRVEVCPMPAIGNCRRAPLLLLSEESRGRSSS